MMCTKAMTTKLTIIIRQYIKWLIMSAICLVLLLPVNKASAKIIWHKGKSRTILDVNSDSSSVVMANHTTQLKLQLEQVELYLKPNITYSSDIGAEINLENNFLRIPLGIWSIYGGTQSVATSFYYQKFGKGYFAAASKEKDRGTSSSGMYGARTFTAGVVFLKIGRDKNSNLTFSYNNAIDARAERRYQTISIKSQQVLKDGHKFGYILSNNDRTLNGVRVTNYYTLSTYYKHIFRPGFTAKFSVGLTYSKDYITEEKHFNPVFNFKLNMEL